MTIHATERIFFCRIVQQPEKQYDHFTPTTRRKAALEGSREDANGTYVET